MGNSDYFWRSEDSTAIARNLLEELRNLKGMVLNNHTLRAGANV